MISLFLKTPYISSFTILPQKAYVLVHCDLKIECEI